jgi:hypothetical protein
MLPLAAASGALVVVTAVAGAILLLLLLFRAEDRSDAEQRTEVELAELAEPRD